MLIKTMIFWKEQVKDAEVIACCKKALKTFA